MAELADRLEGSTFFKNCHAEFLGGTASKNVAGFPFDSPPGGDRLAGGGINRKTPLIDGIGKPFGVNVAFLGVKVDDEITRWVEVKVAFGQVFINATDGFRPINGHHGMALAKFGYSFYCDLFGVSVVGRWQQIQNYVLVRLLLAPVMLWTVVTVVFLLLRATPGDPVDAIYGGRAPAAVKEALRVQLGLDQPLLIQYLRYLGQLLQGNLGISLTEPGRAVGDIIAAYLPATVELGLAGFLVAAGLGIGLGLITGSQPEFSPWAMGGKVFSLVSYAVPLFWLGMVLQLWLSVAWGWFPLGVRFPVQEVAPTGPTGLYVLDSVLAGNGQQLGMALHHLALPSLTLGVVLSGLFERMVRVQVRSGWRGDYVEAAQARGIPPWWILWHHVLPNALIPVVALLGLTLASLLGGAIVTEVTFSWPGLANRLYEAINLRDYPTVQGIVVFLAVVVVVLSIFIDVLTAFIDPRVRL